MGPEEDWVVEEPGRVWEAKKCFKQKPARCRVRPDPSAGTNLKSADSITMC